MPGYTIQFSGGFAATNKVIVSRNGSEIAHLYCRTSASSAYMKVAGDGAVDPVAIIEDEKIARVIAKMAKLSGQSSWVREAVGNEPTHKVRVDFQSGDKLRPKSGPGHVVAMPGQLPR